jgi:hypothetical protein
VKKHEPSSYIKYGTILGLLLLSAIMLSTTDDSLYAQITSDESSLDTDGSGNNVDSSDSSSGSDDDGGPSDSSDTVDNSDSGSKATDEQTNDMTMSEAESNPISDPIIQNVTDELTAVGITDLGF